MSAPINAENRLWNWIGGERSAPAEAAYRTIASPRDELDFREIPASSYMDVVRAVQAANAALPAWQRLDLAARAEALDRVGDAIDAAAAALARDEALESGLPLAQGRGRTVPQTAAAFRQAAARLRDGSAYADGGVAGLILPAFEPMLHFARRAAALLAAGGAAIVKPSTQVSRSVLRLAELIESAPGVPAGLVNVVCGPGAEAGEALIAHPGVRWIAFVGSTEIGRRAAAAAIESGKRAQASLGSRNAAILFGDWPETGAAAAARVLWDAHRPALRASRLFVQEGQEGSSVLHAIVAASRALRVGDPLDPATDVGPLPSRRHMETARAQAAQARSEKGKDLLNADDFARPERGFYVAPQIASDLTLCSTLQQDETLGPLVTESSFKYAHQAASRANASPFGQTVYIWTADRERAGKIAPKLECGRVLAGLAADAAADENSLFPAKGSGVGEEGLEAWLRFFSWTQSIRYSPMA